MCLWRKRQYGFVEKAEINYEEVYGEIKQIIKRVEHIMNNRENYTNKVEDKMDREILDCDH